MQLDATSILPIGVTIIILIYWIFRFRSMITGPRPEDMMHSCERCGREFYSEEKATEHEKECRGGHFKSYECERCGKGFHSEEEALEHEKGCSGILEEKYECEYCGSKFTSKEQVIEHEDHCGNRN